MGKGKSYSVEKSIDIYNIKNEMIIKNGQLGRKDKKGWLELYEKIEGKQYNGYYYNTKYYKSHFGTKGVLQEEFVHPFDQEYYGHHLSINAIAIMLQQLAEVTEEETGVYVAYVPGENSNTLRDSVKLDPNWKEL